MRSALIAVGCVLVLLACGSGSQGGPESSTLRIVVADAPVEIVAGSTLLVQVLVIGPGASAGVISSPDLPPFATLAGSLLTLSPTRAFEGDYPITLVATAGSNIASAVLHVRVSRPNAPPELSWVSMSDDDLSRSWNVCPGGWCTIAGLASVVVVVQDDDRDDVTVELELVPSGQPFTGEPTHSATIPSGNATATCGAAAPSACAAIPLPGLVPGSSYKFALRLRDALGATGVYPGWGSEAEWAGLPSGYSFVQGPCPADGPCACVPTGALTCTSGLDCCSGSCDRYWLRCF